MRLIKIDPTTQTIEPVETSASLTDLYRIINCRCIDFCARQGNGDALIVDDDALYVEPQLPAFSFGSYGQPIHGIALLAGSDDEGETIEPQMSLDQVRDEVRWLGNIHTQPFFTILSF
ncbi:hypothetical protein GCM10023189_32720 [Nibrella saemangeumensis]|uniref:DUF3846 domain-containing protein n=1 Tax=Nibrella saemangeumensis TaxID=1084526 RepID=A0ABP8N4V2_9BACT